MVLKSLLFALAVSALIALELVVVEWVERPDPLPTVAEAECWRTDEQCDRGLWDYRV